jgi:hypothetical protein
LLSEKEVFIRNLVSLYNNGQRIHPIMQWSSDIFPVFIDRQGLPAMDRPFGMASGVLVSGRGVVAGSSAILTAFVKQAARSSTKTNK